ncbi:Uncharacterized protein SVXHr_2025 [Halorhabdus sp. SVX81]|uniref:hypothetical protein n=1 Tax=Halorhabdus sp. SVX81 TaxID=2978283 RepID=UPI0023DA4F19|nr:hypothetical protein [Halorhabdus sp. SVX81]WEL18186.1 Uncharacterized protein SVXHr_2025 [Halorhabdus sp. SVX81]
MRRRTFLTTVGVGITTAAAGCSSQAQSNEPSTETDGSTDDADERSTKLGTDESPAEDTTTTDHERSRIERGETTEQVLGNDSLTEKGLRRPHHVAVTNQTEEERTISLSIQGAETASLDEQYILEPNATVSVSLTDLDTYTVRATALHSEVTESMSIEPSQFTCNVTRTSINLTAAGAFESVTTSTRMACPGVSTEDIAADSTVSKTLGDGEPPADGGDNAHNIVITNPSSETWTVRVILQSETTSQLDGIYTIEPAGKSRLTLTESGTYDIDVCVLETGVTETINLTAENFDCNVSTTQVGVDSEGTLDSTTLSTLMACVGDNETDSANNSST